MCFNCDSYFIFFAFLFNYVVVNFYLYHVVIVLCFNYSPIFIYFVVYLFYCYFILFLVFLLLGLGPKHLNPILGQFFGPRSTAKPSLRGPIGQACSHEVPCGPSRAVLLALHPATLPVGLPSRGLLPCTKHAAMHLLPAHLLCTLH